MLAFGDQPTEQVTIKYNFQLCRLLVCLFVCLLASLELLYKNVQNSQAAMTLELCHRHSISDFRNAGNCVCRDQTD
jgi:hypothetical protein